MERLVELCCATGGVNVTVSKATVARMTAMVSATTFCMSVTCIKSLQTQIRLT